MPSIAAFWICSKCLLLEFVHFKLWKKVSATISAADMSLAVAAVAVCCSCCCCCRRRHHRHCCCSGVTGVGILIRAVQHSLSTPK